MTLIQGSIVFVSHALSTESTSYFLLNLKSVKPHRNQTPMLIYSMQLQQSYVEKEQLQITIMISNVLVTCSEQLAKNSSVSPRSRSLGSGHLLHHDPGH